MVSRKQIDLAKVPASLNVTCPECSCSIPQDEMLRVNDKLMKSVFGYSYSPTGVTWAVAADANQSAAAIAVANFH